MILDNCIYIDFEYHSSEEKDLELVCAHVIEYSSLYGVPVRVCDDSFWLYRETESKQKLIQYLESKKQSHTIVSFAAEAEAASMISLSIDPLDYKWYDTRAEWLLLTNHNADYTYGMHLVSKKIKNLIPAEIAKFAKDETHSAEKRETNLAAACFKILGRQIDLTQKVDTREIILSRNDAVIIKNKKTIIDYCRSDVENLIGLTQKMYEILKELTKDVMPPYDEASLRRGRRSGPITAHIVRHGYPIDRVKTENFSRAVPEILEELKKDISHTVFAAEGAAPFVYNVRQRKWVKSEKAIQAYLHEAGYIPGRDWPKTNGGKFQLSSDVLESKCSDKHTYGPNMISQLVRFSRTLSSINSLNADSPKSFWKYVGSDDRVRPYLSPFGSQSARFYPAASSFLFAKTAWMRALCHPKPNKVIIGADFSQQEFLLNAILSNDSRMLDAYASGDVYKATAISAKAINDKMTEAEVKKVRNVWKQIVLGLGYLMGPFSLGQHLADTFLEGSERKFASLQARGKFLEMKAGGYISRYKSIYNKYFRWVDLQIMRYGQIRRRVLSDGWVMWGANTNEKSVANFGTQGEGAVILDVTLNDLVSYHLKKYGNAGVIFPLHDAVYIEVDAEHWREEAMHLRNTMQSAFTKWHEQAVKYLPGIAKTPPMIRVDVEAWGDVFQEDRIQVDLPDGTKCDTECRHIDKRSEGDYEKWSKYFDVVDNESDMFV